MNLTTKLAGATLAALLAGTALGCGAVAADGLVAQYRFDKDAGDTSGLGNHGQIHGPVQFVPGVFGNALAFNGSSTSVEVPPHPSLNMTAGITITVWARYFSAGPASGSSHQFTLVDSRAENDGYLLNIDADRVQFGFQPQWAEFTPGVGLHAWHHIACTYSGGVYKLYVDGVEVGSVAHTPQIAPSPGPILIGKGTNPMFPEFFNGHLDDLRIYSRALNAPEVQSLYSERPAIPGQDWVQATSMAPWGPQQAAGCEVVEFNRELWLLGGSDGSASSASSSVWRSGDGTNWTLVTSAPGWSGRVGHKCVVHGGKLWLMGGGPRWTGSGATYNDVWWTENGADWFLATNSAAWPARASFGAAVFNNRMFIIGGYASGNLQEVWTSTDGANWEQVSPAPAWTGRHFHSAVVHNGRLWILGGQDSAFLNEIWSTADGTNWVQASASGHWSGRASLGLASAGGKIWVFGGTLTGGSGGEVNDVWCSAGGTNWTQASPSADWPARYVFSQGVTFKDRLWVIGGWQFGAGTLADVWYGQIRSSAQPKLTIEVSAIALSWDSLPGVAYQIEYRPAVAGSDWMSLGPVIIGTGLRMCFDDYILGGPQGFYRLNVMTP